MIFSNFQRVPTFSRGGGTNFFLGWVVQMLISIETYRTCGFAGDGPDPLPQSGSGHA